MQNSSVRGGRPVAAYAIVGALYFSIGMGMDMILALLPSLGVAFAVGSAGVVWVTTARSSSRFLSPLLGRFSDRFGRRSVMLPSLILFALGNLTSSMVDSFGWLVVTQGMAGLGLTGLQVSLPAFLADLFPYNVRGRAIGAAAICSAFGTMLGVPAGAYLAQELGVHTAFLALGVLAGSLIPLAVVFLRASPTRPDQTSAVPQTTVPWHTPLRQRSVRAALIVTFCWLLMSAGVYNFLAAWLKETMNLTTSQIGLTFSLMGGASIVSNFLVASFSDRIGKRRTMLIGLALGTASLVPLGLATVAWQGLVAITLYVLTNELGFGSHGVLITELAPAQRGMVVSLHMAAWGAGVTVAPQLGGLLWQAGGFSTVVLSMSVVGLTALAVAYFFVLSPASPVLRPAATTPQ